MSCSGFAVEGRLPNADSKPIVVDCGRYSRELDLGLPSVCAEVRGRRGSEDRSPGVAISLSSESVLLNVFGGLGLAEELLSVERGDCSESCGGRS